MDHRVRVSQERTGLAQPRALGRMRRHSHPLEVEQSVLVRDRWATHRRHAPQLPVLRHLQEPQRAELLELPLVELRGHRRQRLRSIWEAECLLRLDLMLLPPVPAARRLFRSFPGRISDRVIATPAISTTTSQRPRSRVAVFFRGTSSISGWESHEPDASARASASRNMELVACRSSRPRSRFG